MLKFEINVMFRFFKGFFLSISVERGFMLFMISMGTSVLIGRSLDWWKAIYLGVITFCGWSGVDAINNIFDIELDRESDPLRSEFMDELGWWGMLISMLFSAASLGLGLTTGVPLVTFFILLGIFVGILYSIPPFRLRQTIYKPLVNTAVGAIPVLITSALHDVFTLETYTLALLIGVTTAVNSLWEDLADYASDFKSQAKTLLLVLGFKWGIYITILLGYCLVPLMVIVGLMFGLGLVYYSILGGFVTFMTLRILQRRSTLFGENMRSMPELGSMFAKDFVIIAVLHTTNLMLSGYLKYAFLA